ncbi:MAG: hypothetical protein J5486_04205 [Bacteroidaceae bacterium]|nr:hypothetical protein [Bacteroidaceae bacterium]
MTPFQTYISQLCTRHKDIRHSADETHFACSADSAQTVMAQQLHYPAVFLDEGDFTIGGETGQMAQRRECSLTFVTHVADSGSSEEVQAALTMTGRLLLDFLSKIVSDRREAKREVRGIQLVGAEAHRVELEGAGLYGWMFFFANETQLPLCQTDNSIFDD